MATTLLTFDMIKTAVQRRKMLAKTLARVREIQRLRGVRELETETGDKDEFFRIRRRLAQRQRSRPLQAQSSPCAYGGSARSGGRQMFVGNVRVT